MPRYFTLVKGIDYTDKNNLHTALKVRAVELSNRVIDNENELSLFKETLQKSVDEAHAEYPRCKEIPLLVRDNLGEDIKPNFHISLYCSGVFHMLIYKVYES